MSKRNLKMGALKGLATLSASFMVISFMASVIANENAAQIDGFLNTQSQTIVNVGSTDEDLYTFKSDYSTTKEFVEANKKFAEDVEANGIVLLKNENNALPLKSNEKKVTLVGKAAYSNVLGGQMGSGAANNSKYEGYEQVTLTKALTDQGFEVNAAMSEAYKVDTDKEGNPSYRSVSTISGSFGMVSSQDYIDKGWAFDINEVKLSELEAKSSGITTTGFGDYKTAIVVLGRVNSEGRDYIPGEKGVKSSNTGATDPLGLSDDERAMINMAKEQADKVVVLINSSSAMEIPEVANDEDIDAILWIGNPGCYGMNAVADVLDGTVNPSGKLPDTYAYDNSVSPAAQNWDIFDYANLDEIATTEKDGITYRLDNGTAVPTAVDAQNLRASAYTVYQEGIYVGYKYYETRYFDSVATASSNATSAKGAKAGATSWNYDEEVLYPFGFGLSYTTFEQKLLSLDVNKQSRTITAEVEVSNTGNVDGKDAVQLYVSVPYTNYDKENGIEKSAIQLVGYDKVEVAAGGKQTVTITADLEDIASYDDNNAKTWILDEGNYYFTVGNGSHEATKNVLQYLNHNVDGNKDNVKVWKNNSFDDTTLSTSRNGTKVTNQLDNADLNYYKEDEITYLSRSNWDSTFPTRQEGLEANEEMISELRNKTYEIKEGNVTTKWNQDKGAERLTLAGIKGITDFNDIRLQSLVEQIDFEDAIHIIAVGGNTTWTLDSIENPTAKQADGPNGYSSMGIGGAQRADEENPYYVSDDDEFKNYKLNTTPNAPVVAATFDLDLQLEYGKQIGNMSLWTGGPSIWAGGANQHRSPYEGRTHEYFSEDPVLSSYALLNMIKGAREYGCLVGPKHFAFNAIEYNRYGLSEFMTEQSAREGELRCFQKAFESGECLAVMTAFNRIGASYINGHTGLMQNILRKEWGFKGLATTDMVNGAYMFRPVETIMGGITMMANGQGADAELKSEWADVNVEQLSKDPVFNNQLQQNMKYQWYAYANSNLLNGMDENTVVVDNMTWWKATLISLETIFTVTTAALIGSYVLLTYLKKKSN